MKHLIFHVDFFVLLCFSMSPFDLICSFGLVMAKQLIQQTCLMRCEACTQIQLSYPLPTFLLCSALLTGGIHHSQAQSQGQMEASLSKPETSQANQRSVPPSLTVYFLLRVGDIHNIVCAMFCIFIVYYLLLHKKI